MLRENNNGATSVPQQSPGTSEKSTGMEPVSLQSGGWEMIHKADTMEENSHLLGFLIGRTYNMLLLPDLMEQADIIRERWPFK